MTEWFEEWFGEDYLQLYPHRDEAEAERAVGLILGAVRVRSRAGGCSTWPAAQAAMPAPSRRPAPAASALDLSGDAAARRPPGDRRAAGPGRHARPADPPRLHGSHRQSVHQLRLLRAGRRARRGAGGDGRHRPARRLVRDRFSQCRPRSARRLVPRRRSAVDGTDGPGAPLGLARRALRLQDASAPAEGRQLHRARPPVRARARSRPCWRRPASRCGIGSATTTRRRSGRDSPRTILVGQVG